MRNLKYLILGFLGIIGWLTFNAEAQVKVNPTQSSSTDWANPGSIGSGVPGAGSFAALSATTATFAGLSATSISKSGVPLPTKVDAGIPMWVGTISGTDTLTASMPDVMAYTTGMTFVGVVQNTTTSTTVTLNINSLGNKPVSREANVALTGIGDIGGGMVHQFIFDGTYMQLLNPAGILVKNGYFTHTMRTTTSSVVTGIGFKPRLLLFTSTIAGVSYVLSSGSYDPISLYGMNIATLSNTLMNANPSIVVFLGSDGATYDIATISNIGTDGFTLAWALGGVGGPVGTASIAWTAFK